MNRSASTELDLEAGQYLVMIKITAFRDKSKSMPEEIVKKTCQTRPEKLMAVGLSYDLAHAKGHLKDSELERKERLRRERRDKRRLKAKEVFEAQRKVQKKEKLRRLRLEAKEKAKKGMDPNDDLDAENGVEISIKVGESTLKPIKRQSADNALGGSRVVSREGTSKQLKILVEASDKLESTKGSDQITSGEIEQPIEGGDKAGDAKQALEGTKDEYEGKGKKDEDTDVTGVSATESGQESKNARSTSTSSTVGVAPATSAESSAAAEGNDKAEGQPSAKFDEKAVASGKVTNTKVATEMGGNAGNADQSYVAETDTLFQNLTLDNISDDGLSWNSDVDAPSDSPSETDSDSDSDTDTETDAPAPSPTKDQPTDDPANDPWNAVCIFGLLVYSKGSQAEIEVVRKQDGEDSSVESRKLDVDDRAADATKKLQKGSKGDEQRLETVGIEPAWDEESKQG